MHYNFKFFAVDALSFTLRKFGKLLCNSDNLLTYILNISVVSNEISWIDIFKYAIIMITDIEGKSGGKVENTLHFDTAKLLIHF